MNTAIDSLRARIPIHKVRLLDTKISTPYRRVFEGGEVETDDLGNEVVQVENTHTINEHGAHTKYHIQKQQTRHRTTCEYFVIDFNSKILGTRYFEGVTKDNIGEVYSALKAHSVVNFELSTLLDADITDTDIKTDFISPTMNHIFKGLKKRTKASNEYGRGCRGFARKDNQGVQWSNRRTTAYKTNPFLKIYNKGIEMEYHSTEFYNKHIAGRVDIANMGRIETTIKNAKHFRGLGFEDNKLSTLLDATTEDLQTIINKTLSQHIEMDDMDIRIPEKKHSNIDLLLFIIISQAIDAGYSEPRIMSSILSRFENTKTRSDYKRRMTAIFNNGYKEDAKASEQIQVNNDTDSFLQAIGFITAPL